MLEPARGMVYSIGRAESHYGPRALGSPPPYLACQRLPVHGPVKAPLYPKWRFKDLIEHNLTQSTDRGRMCFVTPGLTITSQVTL